MEKTLWMRFWEYNKLDPRVADSNKRKYIYQGSNSQVLLSKTHLTQFWKSTTSIQRLQIIGNLGSIINDALRENSYAADQSNPKEPQMSIPLPHHRNNHPFHFPASLPSAPTLSPSDSSTIAPSSPSTAFGNGKCTKSRKGSDATKYYLFPDHDIRLLSALVDFTMEKKAIEFIFSETNEIDDQTFIEILYFSPLKTAGCFSLLIFFLAQIFFYFFLNSFFLKRIFLLNNNYLGTPINFVLRKLGFIIQRAFSEKMAMDLILGEESDKQQRSHPRKSKKKSKANKKKILKSKLTHQPANKQSNSRLSAQSKPTLPANSAHRSLPSIPSTNSKKSNPALTKTEPLSRNKEGTPQKPSINQKSQKKDSNDRNVAAPAVPALPAPIPILPALNNSPAAPASAPSPAMSGTAPSISPTIPVVATSTSLDSVKRHPVTEEGRKTEVIKMNEDGAKEGNDVKKQVNKQNKQEHVNKKNKEVLQICKIETTNIEIKKEREKSNQAITIPRIDLNLDRLNQQKTEEARQDGSQLSKSAPNSKINFHKKEEAAKKEEIVANTCTFSGASNNWLEVPKKKKKKKGNKKGSEDNSPCDKSSFAVGKCAGNGGNTGASSSGDHSRSAPSTPNISPRLAIRNQKTRRSSTSEETTAKNTQITFIATPSSSQTHQNPNQLNLNARNRSLSSPNLIKEQNAVQKQQQTQKPVNTARNNIKKQTSAPSASSWGISAATGSRNKSPCINQRSNNQTNHQGRSTCPKPAGTVGIEENEERSRSASCSPQRQVQNSPERRTRSSSVGRETSNRPKSPPLSKKNEENLANFNYTRSNRTSGSVNSAPTSPSNNRVSGTSQPHSPQKLNQNTTIRHIRTNNQRKIQSNNFECGKARNSTGNQAAQPQNPYFYPPVNYLNLQAPMMIKRPAKITMPSPNSVIGWSCTNSPAVGNGGGAVNIIPPTNAVGMSPILESPIENKEKEHEKKEGAAGSFILERENEINKKILQTKKANLYELFQEIEINHKRRIEEKLHIEISEYLLELKEVVEKIHTKFVDKIIQRIRCCVGRLWPSAEINIYGSFATGLCIPESDVDLVISLPDPAGTPSPLHLLSAELKGQSWVKKIQPIYTAKVPVIKLIVDDIPVDITFDFPFILNQPNLSQFIAHTDLFHLGIFHHRQQTSTYHPYYQSISHTGVQTCEFVIQLKSQYPTLEPLVLILKQYLLCVMLNSSYTGGLASYSLVLMVACYLKFYGKNVSNLGSSLLGFFELYGKLFDYDNIGISLSDNEFFFFPFLFLSFIFF